MLPRCLPRLLLGVFLLAVSGSAAHAAPYRVGIVLDKGGKDDKSFNAAAFKGAKEAEAKLGIAAKILEGRDDNSAEPMLRSLADKKFDLIFAIGFSQAEAVRKVAAQYPTSRFVLIDSEVKAANVESVVFAEHQGAFLVGLIAASVSKTGKVGFIGGMDIPLIRRFQLGYEAGVHYAKPKAQIVINYVGVTGEAWNNPPKGKELALAQYGSGVDVIFAAAGATGSGVFDAAEEKKQLAIGVDSNQNGVKPGFILTSLLKRVDLAVYKIIAAGKDGVFKAGTTHYGLEAEGVDFAVDQYNAKLLPQSVVAAANAAKAAILSGKIKVPDYYQLAHTK